MKKYFVFYSNDFANTYEILWAETPEQIAYAQSYGCQQITRREAERLCAAENYRRKHDLGSAEYATTVIYPADCCCDYIDPDRHLIRHGYIMDYRTPTIAAKAAKSYADMISA